MGTMSVANLKADFSDALERVKGGEEILISYGKAKKPVAKLVPVAAPKRSLIGCLKGASFEIGGDWKMTPEELLGL
ncbi:MAG: hypothetical protein LBG50_04590 [Clostridiales Family XIII bacterium]|nr:hypothetical protein [Clostridiales Family XIII bacterium]